jgi:GLPGLI family protein
MNKQRYLFTALLCWLSLTHIAASAQKSVSELTLVYEYSVTHSDTGANKSEGAKPEGAKPEGAEGAVHTVYIKGNKSRSEITNSLFSSTTIFDGNTGSGVILKEVSGQKLLIRLNPENWAERNRMYDGIVYKNTNESKEIAGYKCFKAIGQTKSGATITVYYTRDIIPENRGYEPPFRTLDGLPLEYELTNGNLRIRYKITRINLNPVPVSKFDIPAAGYREMNYEDSKKVNLGG